MLRGDAFGMFRAACGVRKGPVTVGSGGYAGAAATRPARSGGAQGYSGAGLFRSSRGRRAGCPDAVSGEAFVGGAGSPVAGRLLGRGLYGGGVPGIGDARLLGRGRFAVRRAAFGSRFLTAIGAPPSVSFRCLFRRPPHGRRFPCGFRDGRSAGADASQAARSVGALAGGLPAFGRRACSAYAAVSAACRLLFRLRSPAAAPRASVPSRIVSEAARVIPSTVRQAGARNRHSTVWLPAGSCMARST